jgi:hypothetical protein
MLVVFEDHQAVGFDLALGRERDDDVDVAVLERLILQTVVDPLDLFETETAVALLQSGQTVGPGEELGDRTETELVRLRREIAQTAEREAPRDRLRRGERLRVVHRRGIEPDQIVLLRVGVLHGQVRPFGIADRRQVQHGDQRRAGVLRIQVDLAALQGRHRDVGGAEVQLARDVQAGVLEALRVELAQDELLGEVLRADLDGVTATARNGERSSSDERKRARA